MNHLFATSLEVLSSLLERMNAVPLVDASGVATHTGWGSPSQREMDATHGRDALTIYNLGIYCDLSAHHAPVNAFLKCIHSFILNSVCSSCTSGGVVCTLIACKEPKP